MVPMMMRFDVDFAVQFLEPTDEKGSIGRLSDIDIREVIGRGAIGVVLKGWQKELNRFVAVKVMSPYLAVSGAARKRFRTRSSGCSSYSASERDADSLGQVDWPFALFGDAVSIM